MRPTLMQLKRAQSLIRKAQLNGRNITTSMIKGQPMDNESYDLDSYDDYSPAQLRKKKRLLSKEFYKSRSAGTATLNRFNKPDINNDEYAEDMNYDDKFSEMPDDLYDEHPRRASSVAKSIPPRPTRPPRRRP